MGNEMNEFYNRVKSGDVNLREKGDRENVNRIFSKCETKNRATLDGMNRSGTWKGGRHKSFLNYCASNFPEAGSKGTLSRSLDAACIERILEVEVGSYKEYVLRPMYPLVKKKMHHNYIAATWAEACRLSKRSTPQNSDVERAITLLQQMDANFPKMERKQRRINIKTPSNLERRIKSLPTGNKFTVQKNVNTNGNSTKSIFRKYAEELSNEQIIKAIKVFKNVLKSRNTKQTPKRK